jgi:3-dehydroquinate synthase
LSFDVPVAFTTGVFEATNQTLVQCVTRLEPQRCHRLLVVIDAGVRAVWPALVEDITRYVDVHASSLTLAAPPIVIDGGEAAKEGIASAMTIVSAINAAGIDRQSYVLAVGGGAVLDVASFAAAAAVAHRGVRVVRVPTTTLSQGDSGVAVKNGVNFFDKKNFIGTFVPPFCFPGRQGSWPWGSVRGGRSPRA